MKTGIELIAIERQEQIEKHGYTLDHDLKYEPLELQQVAVSIIKVDLSQYPKNWNQEYFYKILDKPLIERLTIAGALLAAEIDRLKSYNKFNNVNS